MTVHDDGQFFGNDNSKQMRYYWSGIIQNKVELHNDVIDFFCDPSPDNANALTSASILQ